MPKLNIDMFPKPPKVGDKVKVLGKVENIDEGSGEVEVSYDDVSFVNKKSSDNNSQDEGSSDNNTMDDQTNPESQSLDDALGQAFNKTQ